LDIKSETQISICTLGCLIRSSDQQLDTWISNQTVISAIGYLDLKSDNQISYWTLRYQLRSAIAHLEASCIEHIQVGLLGILLDVLWWPVA
jgi:hypothetical protein